LAAAYQLLPSASQSTHNTYFFHPNFDITAAARTLVMQKGLYLNNELVQDIHQTIEQSQLIDGRIAIIRAGRDKHLVLVVR
jgi:tyrosyl-tRNA synthetase